MELTDVASELYSVSPDEFTNARNERAKQVKSDGDVELAARIKELRKPAMAAWVVNMMMRHQGEQMEQVLSLGESLRGAQEGMDADALRHLTKQRRQLTTVVTNQGRALARDLGQRVSDAVAAQVEQTLHAAMIDELAASAVRSGLLTEPLAATGVDQVDVDGAVAVPSAIGITAPRVRKAEPKKRPSPSRKPELTVVEDNTRAIEEAKQKVRKARNAAAIAEKKADNANQKVRKLEARSLQLQGELEEVRRRANDLEHKLEGVDDELVAAEESRDNAEEAHLEARTYADEAQTALEKLQR
jgi:uncharacterized phage infection (PIP) family protein YhgE